MMKLCLLVSVLMVFEVILVLLLSSLCLYSEVWLGVVVVVVGMM